MPLWAASDMASRYSWDPERLIPLALASSRTMPMSESPDLVIRVAGNVACLVCSRTLAKPASEALEDVVVLSLFVAGTVGVKLVL